MNIFFREETIPKSILWIIQEIKQINKDVLGFDLSVQTIKTYDILLDKIIQSEDIGKSDDSMELSININEAINIIEKYKKELKNEINKYTELLNKVQDYVSDLSSDLTSGEEEVRLNREHLSSVKRKIEIYEYIINILQIYIQKNEINIV